MHIRLPQSLEDLIKEVIKAGEFSSKSDFMRHCIRFWIDKNGLEELRETSVTQYGLPQSYLDKLKNEI